MLEEAEEEVLDEQGWTGSQATALQRAWLQINPTAPNFWQLVAKQVKKCWGSILVLLHWLLGV